MIQQNCALVNLRIRKGDGRRGPKMAGGLVQRGRKKKGLRGFVHQVRGGRGPKISVDLVQRGRKNKGLRGFVHQVPGGRGLKMAGGLVQRGRKKKGLRGFVHQVRGGRGLKISGDLVQRGGRTRVCGDSCTKSAAAASRAAPRAPTTPRARRPAPQKKTIKNGTMVRQVHRSGALNWYAMWGRVRISSVLSERSVLQPFC